VGVQQPKFKLHGNSVNVIVDCSVDKGGTENSLGSGHSDNPKGERVGDKTSRVRGKENHIKGGGG